METTGAIFLLLASKINSTIGGELFCGDMYLVNVSSIFVSSALPTFFSSFFVSLGKLANGI